MNVPPRPTTPPTAGVTNMTKNRTKNGGGFNPSVNPSFNLSVNTNSGGNKNGNTAGQAPTGSRGGSVPGADFGSNEDIRAFCEHHRKKSRNGATELAMDADHLEAVLRTIPDLGGSLGGSRARARRVSRWLKKAAAAEKNKQKYFAALFGTFEREYDSQLRQIGKGRLQQNRAPGLSFR